MNHQDVSVAVISVPTSNGVARRGNMRMALWVAYGVCVILSGGLLLGVFGFAVIKAAIDFALGKDEVGY